jgi:predicted PurR-regulated permease PerM
VERQAVPWRTIWGTIGAVVTTVIGLYLLTLLSRVVLWMALAALLATILGPAVNFVELRFRCRRSLAVAVVMLLSAIAASGLIYTVVSPLVNQGTSFAEQVPQFLEDAREGKGAAGNFVKRYNLEEKFSEDNLRKFGNSVTSGSWSVAKQVGNALAALISILTLAILMLAKGPTALNAGISLLAESKRARVRAVGAQCAKAVSGYMAGNLLISLVAGTVNFIFLTIADVPFALVLAVWVSISDLIPLIGATLGAIAVVLVAFLDSPEKGIAALVFCLIYQLFENNVLSVAVMSRTVHLDPLIVLISMLVGVELLGIIGAFVAIPVAGMLQVIVRDIWQHRRANALPSAASG